MKVSCNHSCGSYLYFLVFIKQIRHIYSNNLQHTPKSVTALYTQIDADAGRHTSNVSQPKSSKQCTYGVEKSGH